VGYWTGFQIAKVQIGDMPEPVEMRIPEVFRRIDLIGESHEFRTGRPQDRDGIAM
jgi:hypothetical protein